MPKRTRTTGEQIEQQRADGAASAPSHQRDSDDITEIKQWRPSRKDHKKPIKVDGSKKYKRSDGNSVDRLTDRKLKVKLQRINQQSRDAAAKAALSEILLPSEAGFLEPEGIEKTQRFSQSQIREAVDIGSAKKIFTLKLDCFGPYEAKYSRNGRHLLLGGRLGHLATCDWMDGKLSCEVHVKETVRDVCFLHNETMFAAAQKKYVYIYDNQGIEIHCLRNHIEVNRMDFLPYHYLLATVGNSGILKYHDTSTGQIVSDHRTGLGRCDCMRQNPYNAVMLLGHNNGVVTMWSPSVGAPLVKMLCHRGPIHGVAADTTGNYMATCGLDGQLTIWDLRTYKRMHSYFTPTPASTLDISQRGLLSVGFGPHVEIWRDALSSKAKAPYMSHHMPGYSLRTLRFCPFEDVLGIGHSKGFGSIVVPGAGEPNFDTFEANPFQTKKQRREDEVHSLLDKLQPEMISIKTDVIGTVDRAPAAVIREERRLAEEASAHNSRRPVKSKHHARGRDKASKLQKKKQLNIIEEKKAEAREHLEAQLKEKKEVQDARPRTALDRFKFNG